MAYEKYISKNGKLYGPYTYHSKRVNGKVVSVYHGPKKKSNHNFIWIFGIIIGLVLLFGLVFWNAQFVGEVTLEISPTSQVGELLEGVLSFSLKEGELMPASSKVIFDIEGKMYEYILSDIVDANTVSGNFYVEDKSILGSGIGYGSLGTKRVYPEIGFTLNILSKSKSEKSNGGNGGSVSSEVIEIPSEEISTPLVETEVIETEIIEEDETESSESVEIISEEKVEKESEPVKEEKIEKEEKESKPEKEEKKSEPEPTLDASVTGAVIANFFRNTLNAFLVLTGQVSLKLTQEIDGSTSFGESFTYGLSEDETAEIKENSVVMYGELLIDNAIDLDIINNQVVVTTNYFVEEQGFGNDYLGGKGDTISINLSQLNLELEGGNIQVRFVYDDAELVSVSTTIGEVETPTRESEEEQLEIPEIPETNITEIIINETISNITDITNISEENISIIAMELLTDDEKIILQNKYGNVSVEITEAEKIRGRIEATFEIGIYSVKHSYDSSLSSSELEEWIERDRIRLLKDIAYELSKGESSSEVVEGIVGSYSI